MRIYEVALDMVASVCRLSRKVQEHDADLARQMRKSGTSVPLNMAEGLYSRGGNRTAWLQTAMDSARETRTNLHVSTRAGYLTVEETLVDLDRLDHIIATLWKLTGRRSR